MISGAMFFVAGVLFGVLFRHYLPLVIESWLDRKQRQVWLRTGSGRPRRCIPPVPDIDGLALKRARKIWRERRH